MIWRVHWNLLKSYLKCYIWMIDWTQLYIIVHTAMLQCKQVWHWMQLCVRLPNNWNESGHQRLVPGSVPSIKAVTVSQFPRGVSTPAPGALHLSTATMSTWIWMRVKLQWFILYLLLATAYYISSTHDNWQKTEKSVMWQTKIYSNLEVYVDTGVSDGILVMLQLQNWIQKHSYLHLNKLSWFCQVMF